MKKFFAAIMVLVYLVSMSTSAFAEVGVKPGTPSKLPEAVAEKPYADTPNTSVYAPWLKEYHLLTETQGEQGLIGGEACQQFRTVKASPHDPDFIVIGTDTSKVWKTETGGDYWYNAGYSDLVMTSVQDIVFHPTDPDTVYIVSGNDGSFNNNLKYDTDGVYVSYDRCESWEQILHCSHGKSYFDKLIEFDEANNMYVVAGEGIFKSPDYGKTWETLIEFDLTLTQGAARSISVSKDGQTILAAYGRVTEWEDAGLYYTTDGGQNWDLMPQVGENYITMTQLDPRSDDIWYYGSGSAENNTELFKSTDHGHSWEKLADFNATFPAKSAFTIQRPNGEYRWFIHMAYMTYPLKYSDDYGQTWTACVPDFSEAFNYQYTGWMAQGFNPSPIDSEVVWFASGGIRKSEDCGITWTWKNSGQSGIFVNDYAFDNEDRMVLMCVDVGVVFGLNSFIGSEPQTYVRTYNAAVGNEIAIDPEDSNHIIASTGAAGKSGSINVNKNLFETRDRGETWVGLTEPGEVPTQNFIQWDDEDHNIIRTNDYTSYDNGVTWQRNEYRIEAISPVNKNVYYRYEKPADKQTEFFISKDAGKTWDSMGIFKYNLKEVKGGVTYVWPDVADENVIYCVAASRFGRVEYGKGASEIEARMGVTSAVRSFLQNPNNPDHMLVGLVSNYTDVSPSIGESLDGGKTWHPVPGFFGAGAPLELEFSPYNENEIFVGSKGGIQIYNYKAYHDFLNGKINILYNGENIYFSELPEAKGDDVMVPLRDAFELVGAKVLWNDENQLVSIEYGRNKLNVSPGSTEYELNGVKKQLNTAPYMKEDKTFIPVKLLSELDDVMVGWNADVKMVAIRKD